MIVLLEPFGDHSNRLLQDLQLRLWCTELGISYCNPSFADLGKDLVGISKSDRLIGLVTRLRRVGLRLGWKVPHRFGEVLPDPNPEFFRKGLHFVESWDFHQQDLIDVWGDHFRAFYSYRSDRLGSNPFLGLVADWKRQGDTVIGVHIRRGDYRHWQEGKYYFEDSVYRRIIDHMVGWHTPGNATHFVVCTNDPDCSLSGPNRHLTHGTWQQDHTILSLCDFLVGPPSTFTLWASFLGRVRYWHIPDAHALPEPSDFRVFRS